MLDNRRFDAHIALAVVCVADWFVPLGVAVGALYVVAISLAGDARERQIWLLTGAASALTLAMYFVTADENTSWMALVNRGISIVAIVLNALIAVRRCQAREALNGTIRRVEDKNRELENFTYIASHDLQEPIRVIQNYSGLLRTRYADQLDERGTKSLAFIDNGAARMSQLVVALLDYARLGKNSEIVPVDLNQAMADVRDDLAEQLAQSGAEVTVSPLPVIQGMEAELRLLFRNLVSNAIKYVAEDVAPIVRIASCRVDDRWEFSVHDNGIGIPPADAEKAFSMYGRLHRRDDYEGTGIGLAQCKRIVEMHGGNINVRPDVHGGSVFEFSLKEAHHYDDAT